MDHTNTLSYIENAVLTALRGRYNIFGLTVETDKGGNIYISGSFNRNAHFNVTFDRFLTDSCKWDLIQIIISRIDKLFFDYITNGQIQKIFVCSPLRANQFTTFEQNIQNAQYYCRKLSQGGYLPIAPHVYFTSFLNDNSTVERDMGLQLGLRLLDDCDEIWVFRMNYYISAGMELEIKRAKEKGIEILYIDTIESFYNNIGSCWRAEKLLDKKGIRC